MSDVYTGPGGAARTDAPLSARDFRDELRRVVRFRQARPIEDPLAMILGRIVENPAFSQSRLLTRVLVGLTRETGEFRRAEITGLDSETIALVMSLVDAHEAGTTEPARWEQAVESARAAELDAGR